MDSGAGNLRLQCVYYGWVQGFFRSAEVVRTSSISKQRASDCEPTQRPDVELSMINEIVKCHVTFQIRLRHFGPGRSVLNFQKGAEKEKKKTIMSIHDQDFVKKSVSK